MLQPLETERLLLRSLTPAVYAWVFGELTPEEACAYLGVSSLSELQKEKEKYKLGLTTFNKSFHIFQILYKENEEVLGWCGFHTWYLEHKRAELGYILKKDEYKAKGIMTEAINPIIHFGFNEMQLHRVEAFVSPANEPSLKLLNKLGFQQEGYLREHYFFDGKMQDSLVFSLLKREYPNK